MWCFQPEFRIDFRHADDGAYTLRFPSFLPVPLNLLWGFLRFGAVRWTDIPPLRKVVAELHKELDARLMVDAWLDHCGQKPRMREAFWDPLCIAALNQRPQNASARYLQAVLREAFLGEPDGARLGYARTGLSGLFENRAREYISKRGGEVQCGKAVTSIAPASSGIRIHTRSVRCDRHRCVYCGGSSPTACQDDLCEDFCRTPSHAQSIRAIVDSFRQLVV